MPTKSTLTIPQLNRELQLQISHRVACALPTLCEANGKLLGQPVIMVAVEEVAKTRYPSIVNSAGRRLIAQ